METYIVQLLYLLRPILSADLVDRGLLGLNFFELVAILLFLALAVAFLLKALQKNRQPISGGEVWAALLIVWITISYVVHVDISSLERYAKFVIPLATYIMLKRILPDRTAHIQMVFLMLIGFLVPFIMSAIKTYQGDGIGQVIYWTGAVRYQGIYANIHTMGHNAAFAIMATIVYLAVRKSQKTPLRLGEIIVMPTVVCVAIYLLYASQLRSAILGLVIFFIITLYFLDKRGFALFLILSTAFVAYFWSEVSLMFYNIINPQDHGLDSDALGSGRKVMWAWALERWLQAPLLHQFTGMGITTSGLHPMRTPPSGTFFDGTIKPWPNPHNDWLYVLLSLGLIGLAIFVGLLGSILQAILRIPGKEKFALLGFFVAVVVMIGLSNSYISFFALGTMFYMLIVYADLASTKVRQKPEPPN